MPDETSMRRAVAKRDKNYDGVFLYGVITTGIYCRPSCASRRARPENIRFFSGAAEAERAGLRACKRCRPRDSRDPSVQRMQSLARHIEAHLDEPLSLEKLAAFARLSPTHLQRTFKAVFGVSPNAFQDALRAKKLRRELRSGAKVLDSIAAAGYGSPGRVYGQAARGLGMSLSAYRAGGAAESIAYAARDTSLGPLLMAATERGVCFAQFGPSVASLIKQLNSEFPRATIAASDMSRSSELDLWIQALEAHIATSAPRPELPLDLRGTAFQLRVWKFLLGMPEGEVLSYSQVARSIGSPTAIRAVASGCAANRIAVLVPCHRVLRGDGGLGGYRWGLARKRTLLDAERSRRAAQTDRV
jgi:AraC family transcriptional regulator, regulatory protein of adaptative response / methylated-DNA-[protein]-cysteine methyltransferase